MAEVLDLQQLLKVQHVQCVAALELGPLQTLLQQLLQGQKDSYDQLQQQQADIDALKAAQADQQQRSEADQGSPTDAGTLEEFKDQLAALDKRLADLEAKAPTSTTAQSGISTPSEPSDSAAAGSTQDSTHDGARPDADTTSAPMPGASLDPADLQDIKKQLADVAAAHKGLQQQVSALADSKADRADVREMLSEGLRGKADSAAVNQLRTQLGDKADRSELDALLNAMSNSASPGDSGVDEHGSNSNTSADPGSADADAASAGSMQGAQAGSMPSSSALATPADGASFGLGAGGSRRGTKEREAGGDFAQQLSKLQLQLALLQDRVNKKADGQAVADLSDGLAATIGQVSDVSNALQDLQQQLATAQKDLSGLQDRIDSHAPDTGMHAGSGQRAAGQRTQVTSMPAHSSSAAGNRDASTGQAAGSDPAVTALAAKVAALEAAMPGLQAAIAAAQQPRRVSGEMPASSKLVQVLAAQLSDLGAQVARLAAAQNPSAGAPGADSGLDDAHAAEGFAPATGAGAADAAGVGAAGGGFSGTGAGFGAELAAELDGRLSDVEALVQDLAAVKADQAGLQELRALLADTATQADTDQLRQRLNSQQSLLDRLSRQLSSMNSSNSNGRGSRPQSTAGGSGQHSSTGAGTPVGHEYSFFGGAAAPGADAAHALHADAHWPADAVDAVGTGLSGDQDGLLGDMQAQLAAHQESLEQLAEAISLLATGQAAPAATAGAGAGAGAATAAGAGVAGVRGALAALHVDSEGVDLGAGRFEGPGEGSVPETPSLRFQRGPSMQQQAGAGADGFAGLCVAAGAARPGTALGSSSLGRGQTGSSSRHAGAAVGSPWGRQGGLLQPSAAVLGAGPGPQVSRLKRLLQTGQVGCKMDWFDPTLLQKMAQRLAAIDAMLRNGAGAGSAGAPTGDLEGRLKRLASEVRQLKDRMAELLGASGIGQGGLRGLGQATDGDHSMLSGKPLGGYRCMACDRPLAALDSRPGPHLPTGQLPVSLASGAEVVAAGGQTLGKLPPASAGPRRSVAAEATAAHAADPMLSNSTDGSKRAVGPQNWYTSVHGLPAEQLPKADVGPHLPPGGWRGNQPLRGEDGAPLLPAVRGGSTASGGGVTPRGQAGDRASSSQGVR